MAFSLGWTDVPGISRTARLRLLGNSVVVNQAAAALTDLLGVINEFRNDPDPEPAAVTVEIPDEVPALNDQAAALLLRMLIEHRPTQYPAEPCG